MKFKIFTFCLFLFAAGFLHSVGCLAQSKKVSVGLKLGANYSQINELSYKTPRLDMSGMPVMSGGNVVYDFFQQNDGYSTGIVGGVYARFGGIVYLQPEVLLSVKGGKMNLIRDGLENLSLNANVGTIDLPLLLGLKLGPLRINAGPMASLTVINGDLKSAVKQYSNQSISTTAQQAQFGYQAGVGITFSGMQLDLRHEGGLSTVLGTSASRDRASISSSLWQLTAGFGF